METEQKKKPLVLVIELLGAIIGIAGFLGIFGLWDMVFGTTHWAFRPAFVCVLGIHIGIIGRIIGHYKAMTSKQRKYLWIYLLLLLLNIILIWVAYRFTEPERFNSLYMGGTIMLASILGIGYSTTRDEED